MSTYEISIFNKSSELSPPYRALPKRKELHKVVLNFSHFCFTMLNFTRTFITPSNYYPKSPCQPLQKQVLFLIIGLAIFSSCSTNNKVKTVDKKGLNETKPVVATEIQPGPDYNYILKPLPGWIMFDTTIQGLDIRFLIGPPSSAKENLFGNIVIAAMGKKEIDAFTESNMNYLNANEGGIDLLEKGKINIDSIDSRWFTYTKSQNGITRDMINYLIPLKGFSYMITFGTNKGRMSTYRPIFDKIAKTFSPFPLDKAPDTKGIYLSGSEPKYLKTGFYFLEGMNKGIMMHKDLSDETYFLKDKPFASVENVIKARLLRTRISGSIYPVISMQFDENGTNDLREGTALPTKFAVVIANRLLYVIDNSGSSSIKTGVMQIILEDYSEEEAESMLNAILHKR
jgi:PsbP-like protein